MSDLPYLEELDSAELGLADQASGLLAVGGDVVADGFAPQTWHLLGRHAYYALGAASSAVEALVHEANRGMDLDALDAVAGALRQALTLVANAVGDQPE